MLVVQDPSRMGQQLVITGGGSDRSRGRGVYGSLPAQELLLQLQLKALGARSLPPEQKSYRSQRPASTVPSHSTQGHNWLQVASESHFGLREPRE